MLDTVGYLGGVAQGTRRSGEYIVDGEGKHLPYLGNIRLSGAVDGDILHTISYLF